MDYLDAIADERAHVTLAGKRFEVRRAHLGLWYRIRAAQVRVHTGELSEGSWEAIIELVALGSGRPLEWVQREPSMRELTEAAAVIEQVNRPRGDLPYMRATPGKGDGWNYENRGLASLVHKLATTYGWTREYILDKLYPEEVFCYVQEILLDDYNRQAYDYYTDAWIGFDKSSNEKKPFPPIGWPVEVPEIEHKLVRMPREVAERGFLPSGVIKLTVDDFDDEKVNAR